MPLEEITLALFVACNSIRVVAHVPQVLKAATDRNGASSISMMTWALLLVAHLSTVAYALVNRSDLGLAACPNQCRLCGAILAIVWWKRRTHHRPQRGRALGIAV
jgi:hypothetical protein